MRLFLFLLFFSFSVFAEETLLLRNQLMRAQPGDYLVISSSKTETVMHIYDKKDRIVTIEEVAIPENKRPQNLNWKEWILKNAPGNTSWVMYDIDVATGQMLRYYSFTKNGWFEIPEADNFISKLLNLKFGRIPENQRKRVGPKPISGPEWRSIWQPPMIVEGKKIPNITFDGWKTKWPKDSTDLSGRTIEIFLPQDQRQYLSYFPYWLQIQGAVGKAKIRIIDSGRQMKSPKPPFSKLTHPSQCY